MAVPGRRVISAVAPFLRWTKLAGKRSCTTSTEEQTEPTQIRCWSPTALGICTEQLRRVVTESAAARDAEPSLSCRLSRTEAGRRQSSMHFALFRAAPTARRPAPALCFATRQEIFMALPLLVRCVAPRMTGQLTDAPDPVQFHFALLWTSMICARAGEVKSRTTARVYFFMSGLQRAVGKIGARPPQSLRRIENNLKTKLRQLLTVNHSRI